MPRLYTNLSKCADMVILNARVYTGSEDYGHVQAVAVKDGKILCVGDNEEIIARACPATIIVDAEGRSLVPGMVDAHQHLLYGVRTCRYNICLDPLENAEENVRVIERYIRLHPDMKVYTGTGFAPEAYPCCGPRRETLDAICADKPIIILAYDGHTTWVNSAALRAAGISRDTPDPEMGVIFRDKDGEATGYLAGAAGACEGGMMSVFMPVYTRAQNKAAIMYAQDEMFRMGVTTIYDAHVEACDDYYMAYEELAREGRLRLAVRGAWFIPRELGGEAEINALIDECIEKSRTLQTHNFQVNGFKFLCDQVCEAETAYLSEPYADRRDGWRGVRIWEDDAMLARIFARIDAAGFQIHLHQMGDGAANYALNALECAAEINGGLKMRHTFAHCQFISGADKVRMARLGINALSAPYWINSTIFNSIDVPCLGETRARTQYPVKSLIEMGVNVGAHSDYTVSKPDWCDAIYGLTARALSPRNFDKLYCHVTGAEYTIDPSIEPCPNVCCPLPCANERLDLDSAICCITLRGARSMYLDGETGSIEVGKAADMVLLDGDISKLLTPNGKCFNPVMTIRGGDIVYQDFDMATMAAAR